MLSQQTLKTDDSKAVVAVRNLVTRFRTDDGIITAIDGVSFAIQKGRTLGVVGESGCGKSVTSLSIMRLLPAGVGEIAEGSIMFDGQDLAKIDDEKMRDIRGNRIAMIFQEPMTALNPVLTAGEQIMEVFMTHKSMNRRDARLASIKMMEKVRIPDPIRRMDEYPHQMSGGMKQRVMIAIALACEPVLIIADEPTTALDVTIQAQILRLMQDLQRETGTAIMFITHDLGVIAEMADDVVVMYAGQVIESASVLSIFDRPMHPYTQGLLKSIPNSTMTRDHLLPTIVGNVPSLNDLPAGCRFQDRCPYKKDRCVHESPRLRAIDSGQQVACHFAEEIAHAQSLKGNHP